MAAKVIRIRDRDAQSVDSENQSSGGWHPIEVWRTRVLLPRLEESHSERPQPQPKKRSFLRRLRRKKKDD